MKVTTEELQQLKSRLPEHIPQEAIEKLLGMFPEGIPFLMAASLLENALRDLPEGLTADQIAEKVMEKMQSQKKAASVDSMGNSKKITRDYFDSLLLEMRLMGSVMPSTRAEYFGETFDTPIMTTALSHLGRFHPDLVSPMEMYAAGAKEANALHWVGMCENEEFGRIVEIGARTVRIIKPYADEEKIYDQIRYAEEVGAIAVGMDIDHTFTQMGEIDVVMGELMEAKSLETMKAYVDATGLPFVIKGVLSVSDAVKCAEIGAKAIVVSHHGGRLPYAVPPLMVLPDIAKAVGDEMQIFVDCGVISGMDAYKAMALGASGVGVGGHLIPEIREGGSAAVAARIKSMTDELRGAMAYTGAADCGSFDPSVLHRR